MSAEINSTAPGLLPLFEREDCRSMFSASRLARVLERGEGEPLDVAPVVEDFFKMMLDELYDGVYFVDAKRRILYWNAAAERISGYSASEVVGSYCFDNILDHTDPEGCRLCHDRCPLVATLESRTRICKRVFLKHRDGHRFAVEVRASPVLDDRGRLVGAVEVFRDARAVLALESAYRSARELSEKDALTGLANRRSLASFVAEQLALCRRSGRRFSLMMLDLDHFKRVNDTLGHAAGDQVLAAVATILLDSCREMDLAARYGGEEFTIVLPGATVDRATAIAERVRNLISERLFRPARGSLRLSVSIGVAESVPGDDWDSLISRADGALYVAKLEGRNRVHVSPRGDEAMPLWGPLPECPFAL
jgi:diguanylate cyclase (GGDEF)-like protein/PAS domain S-box-containing protein